MLGLNRLVLFDAALGAPACPGADSAADSVVGASVSSDGSSSDGPGSELERSGPALVLSSAAAAKATPAAPTAAPGSICSLASVEFAPEFSAAPDVAVVAGVAEVCAPFWPRFFRRFFFFFLPAIRLAESLRLGDASRRSKKDLIFEQHLDSRADHWSVPPPQVSIMSDITSNVRPAEPTHPSLRPVRIPRRSRGFSDAVVEEERPSRPRRGLIQLSADVAGATGPVGGLIAAGVNAVVGGSEGQGASDVREENIDQMWEMQRESQAFNLEYLALQESMQSENRRFTTMSNLMKARHDTSKSAISNIRV